MLFKSMGPEAGSRLSSPWRWVGGVAAVIAVAVGLWLTLNRSQQPAAPATQNSIPAASETPTTPPTTSPTSIPDVAAAEQTAETLFKQKRYSNARPMLKTACDADLLKACPYLGYLYAQGLGGSKNLQAAREVYQKACEGGPQSSCYSLASLYMDAGDKAKARVYFEKACLAKVSDSCDLLNSLQ
jgi:TPR repeat protein